MSGDIEPGVVPAGAQNSGGAWLLDSLLNMVTGLGGNRDPSTATTFTGAPLSRPEIENAFRYDWIARKIIMLPAKDMVREGRSWQTKKNTIEALEEEEKRLKVWEVLFKALWLERLDGGSAILIGGPGRPDEPLEISQIGKGGLKYLFNLRRWDLTPDQTDFDLYSPYFGQPTFWRLSGWGGPRYRGEAPRIHPSRIIMFGGAEIPDPAMEPGGWGDSVLQHVKDAVLHAGVAQAGIAGLIHEAKIDVVKVPNLMEHLATDEYTRRLIQRFSLAAMAKSQNNTLILDNEEEWDRKQINFTQLPDVLKLYLQVVAAASEIPATHLVGLSPQGLNATGDTEERMYYDRVRGDQRSRLQPKLEGLDEMIKRSAVGRSPRDVFYVWNPLWQITATEAATNAATKANAMKTIKETGLFDDEVLRDAQANQIIEDGVFPGFEAAYEASQAGTDQGAGPGSSTAPESEQTEPAARPAPAPRGDA